MTTYGTIPAELPPSTTSFIFRARQQLGSGLGSRRKWEEMIKIQALSFPSNLNESIQRIQTNAAFFRTNYVIIVLLLLFLTLLCHPFSLFLIVIMAVAWFFQYFFGDRPLSIEGFVIDRSTMTTGLTLFTIATFFLTDVVNNIITGVSLGLMVVLIHGLFRRTDDLFIGDEEAAIRPRR